MNIRNEIIKYENPLLSLKIFHSKRKHSTFNSWHYHKELEFLVIIDGSLEVHIEDEVHILEPGDMVLIGSHQLHRDCKRDGADLEYIVLQFDLLQSFDQSTMPYMKYFAETKTPLSQLNYIFQENQTIKLELFNNIQTIYQETQHKKLGYEIAVTMLIKNIILSLLRNDHKRILDYSADDEEMLRIRPVLEYIEEHLSEKITVEEAAKLINMSYYYFVKYFKKAIGMSFTEYVNYKKVKKAERMLLTEKYTISYIGDCIGLPNMAHFYKLFRKYNHCSPKEFRQKMLSG